MTLNAARIQRRLYPQAGAIAGFGAWECDLSNDTLSWTDGIYDLFGLPRGADIIRADTVEMYQTESRRQMEWLRREAIRTGGGFTLDARIFTDRGEGRWMRLTAQAVHKNGHPTRLFGAKQDITRDRLLLDRLRECAERDLLTGLANRTVFDTQCRQVALGLRQDVVAMAVLDLDHFKLINDRSGHAAGDECLRQLADRLRLAFKDAALVSRIGGDEFVLLLRAPPFGLDWSRTMARLMPTLSRPVPWEGQGITLGISIGLTMVNRATPQSATCLFAEADSALYEAKAAGRGTFRIHGAPDPTMRLAARHG